MGAELAHAQYAEYMAGTSDVICHDSWAEFVESVFDWERSDRLTSEYLVCDVLGVQVGQGRELPWVRAPRVTEAIVDGYMCTLSLLKVAP
jgi:hypothetical protein